MTHKSKTSTLAALVLCSTAFPLSADTYIAVLADAYSEDAAQAVAQATAEVFNVMRAGDRFTGLGANGRELWDITVPSDPLYDVHKRQLRRILEPTFGVAMNALRAAITTNAPDTQVNFPIILHDALRFRSGADTHVAFFGNPLWHEIEVYEVFTLRDAWPSHAHFGMDRATTPFGRTPDNPHEGVVFHFCEVDPGDYQSGAHRDGVMQTYGLMAAASGGQLVTFSPDIAECGRRFAIGETSNAPMFKLDSSQTQFSMISGSVAATQTTTVAPSNGSPQLAAAIQSGMVNMRSLRLYDSQVEDGDVVEIIAPGFSRIVPLTNAGVTLDVPLVHGQLILRGIDAGTTGGVTVSVSLPSGEHIITETMAVGQEITLALPQ